jgi:hypothetical protein
LDQVRRDRELPSSAFVVAYELNFNAEYGGAAWQSIETLAKDTGLSEPSIVRITRQLAQHGYLKIEAGRPGRGSHSNRYFMVKQTSADGGLQTSAGESQTSAGGVDLSKTHRMRGAKAPPHEDEGSLRFAADASAPRFASELRKHRKRSKPSKAELTIRRAALARGSS